jgi:endonuclease/exonuclease/phosphatase family metal-dependent hydrolase
MMNCFRKITVLFELGCFSYTAWARASEAPVPTLAQFSKQDVAQKLALDAEIADIATNGSMHLRTRESPLATVSAILLSFLPDDGGTAVFRILNSRGEDAFLGFEKISATEFVKKIFTPSSVFKFESKSVIYNVKVDSRLVRTQADSQAASINMRITVAPSARIGISCTAMVYFDVLSLSYNILNYWDGNPSNTAEERLYGYDEFTTVFSNWYDPKVQQAKAESLARVLRLAELPDVVALQELEWAQGRSDVFAADSFLRKTLESLGYRSFLLGKQSDRNKVAITTGIVSRYALNELPAVPFSSADPAFAKFLERERISVSHSTRDIQVAELRFGGSRLRFFNNHWRSKGCSGEESCDLSDRVRVANGEVLARELADIRKSDSKVKTVVMGDFNSSFDDAAIKKLGSSAEKSQIAAGKQAGDLYNLWFDLPEENRWEHEFSGRRNTLSQILISDSLFESSGFQYVDGSFSVLGQSGVASEILMNPNGTPLRWQEVKLRFEEAPSQKRDGMRAAFVARGCSDKTKNKNRRKCREAFTEYTGVGYSDHLPIRASFAFAGYGESVLLKVKTKPNKNASELSLARCTIEEASSLDKIEFWKIEHLGRCVVWRPATPQPLKVRGVYEYTFVVVKENAIGITMNGAYNPFAGSKRVVGGVEEKATKETEMNASSDMCYSRKVLQHEGGSVAMMLGRLGFDNGMPTLFLYSRDDIDLDDLPEEKSKACR